MGDEKAVEMVVNAGPVLVGYRGLVFTPLDELLVEVLLADEDFDFEVA